MIRVLHYGLGPNRGGIETYLIGLANRLVGANFHFDFVYTNTGAEPCFQEELREMGANFYPLTPRKRSPLKNRVELHEVLATGFDVFHCHLNTLSYAAPIRSALRLDVPVIIHSHNTGASRSAATRFLHSVNALTVALDQTTNVAVSSEAGKWLFGSSKFTVMHNGIDTETYRFNATARAETRSALGLNDRLTLGHVGAFLPAKNHSFLLRVFKAVLAKRPDSSLLLIGSGPLEEESRREAKALGVLERVHFAGTRSDVPQLLSAMDVLVFPSLHEGLPMTVIEAQASGLPCFVSEYVTPEVIAGRDCRLLPLESPHEWAEAIVKLDQTLSRDAGAAQVAVAGFDGAHAAELVAETYSRIVEAASAGPKAGGRI